MVVLCQENSVIHSNANLGVHGQGLLNLSGTGDTIEAQRLILSLFYSINVSVFFLSSINACLNNLLFLWLQSLFNLLINVAFCEHNLFFIDML